MSVERIEETISESSLMKVNSGPASAYHSKVVQYESDIVQHLIFNRHHSYDADLQSGYIIMVAVYIMLSHSEMELCMCMYNTLL